MNSCDAVVVSAGSPEAAYSRTRQMRKTVLVLAVIAVTLAGMVDTANRLGTLLLARHHNFLMRRF